MSESITSVKYQAGFGVIISGQNPQTFMIPIYSTTILYDTRDVVCVPYNLWVPVLLYIAVSSQVVNKFIVLYNGTLS